MTPLTPEELITRLRILQQHLYRGLLTQEDTLIAVFNELLAAARELQPNDRILSAIPNQRGRIWASSLRALIDQMVITLRETTGDITLRTAPLCDHLTHQASPTRRYSRALGTTTDAVLRNSRVGSHDRC
jgi:hypothetical protein